jgi:RimJ/RimL family protein N-acetyltransferase
MNDEPGTSLVVDELLLRPWRPTDTAAVVAACQDPEIARWVSIPQPYLATDAEAFIAASGAMWRDGTGAPFAITEAATGQLLGAVTMFGPDGHQATVGLWLVPAGRGRGAGTRSLRKVADWAFATTDVFRIDCFLMVGNLASERMVERAGFQREGILRGWDMHGGSPVDCTAYARLRTDE